jgi:cytochrome b6-f complex iron-sulfur subunit
MDTWLIVLIVVVAVALAGVVVVASARRRDTGEATGVLSRETRKRDRGEGPLLEAEAAETPTAAEIERAAVEDRLGSGRELELAGVATAPAPYTPPDPETIGVTRRQFFNRSIVLLMAFSLASFGAAVVAFLWPQSKGGFGSAIRIGAIPDIKASIAEGGGFYYVPEGKLWLTEYPPGALEKARAVYTPPELAAMEAGVVALFQKCPHLGCKVPECLTSQWFECPCHGSRYNQVGEKRGGPAPRGMDHFATQVDGDVLTVDTGTIIPGPPIGTNTTGQEPEGPSCLGASTH